jgi:hypothetical protein
MVGHHPDVHRGEGMHAPDMGIGAPETATPATLGAAAKAAAIIPKANSHRLSRRITFSPSIQQSNWFTDMSNQPSLRILDEKDKKKVKTS